MKRIFKIFGFARASRSSPPATGIGEHGARHWQEDYLLGASDMDARWYYERRRWRTLA
jgi:hypothetical protein